MTYAMVTCLFLLVSQVFTLLTLWNQKKRMDILANDYFDKAGETLELEELQNRRLSALEKTLADMDISEETARKTMRQMQAFNDGVAAILNYDGNGGGKD